MTVNIFSYKFAGPIGDTGMAEMDGKIIRVFFDLALTGLRVADNVQINGMMKRYPGYEFAVCETDALKNTAAQFNEYFTGKRPAFDVPYTITGDGFTGKVYRELLNIPAGRTRSYGDIAAACGNPRAYRAVGNANRKNPIPYIVPCHRVIGGDGGLTGYAGGLPIKKYLLDIEQKFYL